MIQILRGWRILFGGATAAALTAASPVPVRSGDVPAALRTWIQRPDTDRAPDAPASSIPLDRAAAGRVLAMLTRVRLRSIADTARDALSAQSLKLDGKRLRWESRTFGIAPAGGRSLWISLHGGGNAPAEVNDGQWHNQTRLYMPAEGVYVAPRAPTDTWNLWHEAHVDPLLQRLIDIEVAVNNVDPNKVYLLGYSAGGDGVWQLAPRMADRFAAAASMAGHPNDARLEGLRNLPFAILVGGDDDAYDRNRVAAEKSAELAQLHRTDPGGYASLTRIYPGLPHWMDRKDAEALPWMERFRRDPWPKRVVWVQDDVRSDRFYWLQIPHDAPVAAGDQVIGTVTGQTIALIGKIPPGLTIRLSDSLVDLDRPVTVTVNGRASFRGRVARTARAMWLSLLDRADPSSAAAALVTLT